MLCDDGTVMETVTLSLQAWLHRCVPEAELCFEEEDQERHEKGGKGVVQARLYDVREEEQSRGGRMFVRQSANATVTARLQPLRVLQYSYRLTSHACGWLESQRLLGQIMTAGAATPCLPDDLVHASLREYGSGALPLVVAPATPVPLSCSTPPLPRLSPALHLMIMAPLRPAADFSLPPTPRRVDLGIGPTAGTPLARRNTTTRPHRIKEHGT
ncbi:hypothetical protein [Streptomyces wuyuanensis]|uniref:hypothetical protein n=1 Tax=Streptomyces wuyuanensis TaxID=1196353 RepID=UPI0034319E04